MKLKRVHSVAFIASCAGLILSTATAWADTAKNQAAITREKQAEKNNPYTELKTAPPNLPYMPVVTPPGGKYLQGMKDTDQRGKITLILRYGVQGAPSDTLHYYSEALRNAHWQVLRSTDKMVMATYKGHSVSLSAYPGSHKDFKNDVVLNYQMPPNQ